MQRAELRHLTEDILRIGHRGAPSHFWENTVRSLQKAIEIGVDMVEFDIRRTLDGHFVLCHSSRLGRFFPFSGRVARKRMGDLIHCTAGNGEPIARLQDAIAAVKGRALMNIDLKSAGGEEKLVDVIVGSGVPVYAYTVDDPKAMRKVMKMGVRGIASNRPELLVHT